MYEKITLSNGIRIVYEQIPYVRSVSMGIWVGTGSRFETASENGESHFIEHMLFKGTKNRSAADIAWESDSIGGQINAFTTRDCTCFYGRVLDTHLGQLTDILCDMFFNSSFDESDVESERGVIYEEIDMYEDTPDDLVAERHFNAVFNGSSLSLPVLGTKETLSSLTGDSLKTYMQEHYDSSSVVIALSGSFTNHDIDRLCKSFGSLGIKKNNILRAAAYKPAIVTKKKDIEQNHLCIGFPGISYSSNERFAFGLMSNILGGNMSSRLFQSVRENNGLCYSIYSYCSNYASEGLFSIYTALSRETEAQAIRLIKDVITDFRENGVTDEEVRCVCEQAKSNILMGLESTSTRMHRLGRGELSNGFVMDIDDVCAAYDSVTKDDIKKLAEKYLSFDMLSFSAVGKTGTEDYYREILGAEL